jgi:hypothetical protein
VDGQSRIGDVGRMTGDRENELWRRHDGAGAFERRRDMKEGMKASMAICGIQKAIEGGVTIYSDKLLYSIASRSKGLIC